MSAAIWIKEISAQCLLWSICMCVSLKKPYGTSLVGFGGKSGSKHKMFWHVGAMFEQKRKKKTRSCVKENV